jgi:hypothetical protein
MFNEEPTTHTFDAINTLINLVIKNSVEQLASTYSFNANEAFDGLKKSGLVDIPQNITIPTTQLRRNTSRTNKSSNLSPNIPLPWCGQKVDAWCHALRVNHNLFSQCTNPIDLCKDNNSYCNTCWSNYLVKNTFRYGTVEDRIATSDTCGNTVDFMYNNGTDKSKKALPYANIMAKHAPQITREQAEIEAARFGLTIPEEQFVPRILKRGRPSAKVVVTPMDSHLTPQRINDLPPELGLEKPVPHTTSDAENEVEVEEFVHNGTNYYRGNDGTIYCPKTQSAVGRWDEPTSTIILL